MRIIKHDKDGLLSVSYRGYTLRFTQAVSVYFAVRILMFKYKNHLAPHPELFEAGLTV